MVFFFNFCGNLNTVVVFVRGVTASSQHHPVIFKETLYLGNKLNLRRMYLSLLLTAYHTINANGEAPPSIVLCINCTCAVDQTALRAVIDPMLSNGEVSLWISESVWTLWRRENVSCSYRESKRDPAAIKPMA